jgi:hypothetical protein
LDAVNGSSCAINCIISDGFNSSSKQIIWPRNSSFIVFHTLYQRSILRLNPETSNGTFENDLSLLFLGADYSIRNVVTEYVVRWVAVETPRTRPGKKPRPGAHQGYMSSALVKF